MPIPRPYPPTTHIIWRKYVLERDLYICQNCQGPNSHHAHHIKSYINHPELRLNVENGITLCSKCHSKIKKERQR